jgi:hypothetical protein
VSQNQNRLTPDDVRLIVIIVALAGAATDDKYPAGWQVERAFHLGDRVRESLKAEERGEPIRQWRDPKTYEN